MSFIGVDWGTTNLRAWRLSQDGRIEDSIEGPLGVSAIGAGAFADVLESHVRAPLGRALPVLICGMAGSSLGWREAPYARCPAGLEDLARMLTPVSNAPPIQIAPGMRCDGITGAPDIMRGEETQILGWLAVAETHRSGARILCLPGTHSKWALVREDAIVRFVTAMTGELFALLSTHSILKSDACAPFDPEAFAEGVTAAGEGEALSIRMFSARTRIVAAQADKASAHSYLSGLLIGSEIAAARAALAIEDDSEVCVIGAPSLVARYVQALAQRGVRAGQLDGAIAAAAGLAALYRQGGLR